MSTGECSILDSLFKSLNLQQSSSQSCCTWKPVVGCSNDTNGVLAKLDLSRKGLSGPIPAELGNLTNLQFLYLDNNSFNGSIPAQLGNLASLRHLNLGYNQLKGSIPAELGNLSTLEHLYLDNNQLQGPIPVELGNLAKLEYFNVHNNPLSGPITSLPSVRSDCMIASPTTKNTLCIAPSLNKVGKCWDQLQPFSPPDCPSPSLSIGIIVGIVAASLAALALAVFAFRRFRQDRTTLQSNEPGVAVEDLGVKPGVCGVDGAVDLRVIQSGSEPVMPSMDRLYLPPTIPAVSAKDIDVPMASGTVPSSSVKAGGDSDDVVYLGHSDVSTQSSKKKDDSSNTAVSAIQPMTEGDAVLYLGDQSDVPSLADQKSDDTTEVFTLAHPVKGNNGSDSVLYLGDQSDLTSHPGKRKDTGKDNDSETLYIA